MLPLSNIASAQDLVTENPNKVKAAYLRNFAHYVTWPEKVFDDTHSPWRICVLGKDPFGEVLENTLAGRTEQERPFAIHRASTLDRLPRCQIIYIAYDDPARRRAVLATLKDRPVLTVADANEFLWEGGIIRFQVGERVRLSINLDQAQAAGLVIQTKMLEVSYEVLRSGALAPPR